MKVLVVHEVVKHGRRNEQLVGTQECIAGKMDQHQPMKPNGGFDEHRADLGRGRIGYLGFTVGCTRAINVDRTAVTAPVTMMRIFAQSMSFEERVCAQQ